jgi:hypothetical protein
VIGGGIHGDRHNNRGELHGITVVLSGKSGRTYLGRWHEETPHGVVMKNVAIHDPHHAPISCDEWLAKQRKFGIEVQESVFTVPSDEAGEVVPFG